MKWKFSPKQLLAMYWWKDPKWSQASGFIADGSVRAGKTYAMAFGFMLWSKECFEGQTFGLCGKTIKSFERNVLGTIQLLAKCFRWKIDRRRIDNCIVITYPDGHWNQYYIFGGNDERSQDLIQGVTLAGILLDEVALMPESFVNQAVARCSVTGSKIWMNCNPNNPSHFVKKEFIDKRVEKGYIFSHFTMADNYTLSAERRHFFETQWSGVFYQRYILGLWVAAEGAIYQYFSEHRSDFLGEKPNNITRLNVGLDYGASKSRCALECTGITSDRRLVSLCEDHMAGIHTPDEIYAFVASFLRKVEYLVGMRPQILFCDYGALGQVLTKGLREYLPAHGCTTQVSDCKKGEIIERIQLTVRLMGEGRYLMTPHCPELAKAFEAAVWEEDKVDTRLDNFTSDIDSLDAFEYSFFSFANNMLA